MADSETSSMGSRLGKLNFKAFLNSLKREQIPENLRKTVAKIVSLKLTATSFNEKEVFFIIKEYFKYKSDTFMVLHEKLPNFT